MSNSTDLYTNASQVTTLQSNGGLAIPHGSTAQRPTGLLRNGTLRFNATLGRMETYIAPNWVAAIDENYGNTIYVTKKDGEVTTNLNFNDNRIINLADPVDPKDGVTLQFLLQKLADLEGNVDAGTLSGHPIEDFVLITRNVNTGLGLLGGGSLATDLTIEMAPPLLITGDTVNEATVDGHSHEITLTHEDIVEFLGYTPIDVEHVPDPTEVVFNTTQVIAGLGLVGGGTLESDVALHVGTPSAITVDSTNNSDVGTHSHELILTKEDLETIIGSEVADADVSVIAGDGLVGGGNLKEDRTLTLATPSTISLTTDNVVSENSHSHKLELTKAQLEGIMGPIPTFNNDTSTNFPLGSYVTAQEYRTSSGGAGIGIEVFVYGGPGYVALGIARSVASIPRGATRLPGTWRSRGVTGRFYRGSSGSSENEYYDIYYLVQKTAN